MDRDLAIKVIKRMIKTGIAYDDGYAYEPLTKDEEKACGMAIKALEQEPCEDCISRQAVLDLMEHYNLYSANLMKCLVSDMPSVNAEQKTEWIPASKELPKEGEEVLVWYEYFRYGDYNCMWQAYGIGWQYDGHFDVDNGGLKQRVIAWCKLPEPYKVESE